MVRIGGGHHNNSYKPPAAAAKAPYEYLPYESGQAPGNAHVYPPNQEPQPNHWHQ